MTLKWGFRCLLAAILLICLLAIAGCRGLGASPPQHNPSGPTIASFTATPSTIGTGGNAILNRSNNANHVTNNAGTRNLPKDGTNKAAPTGNAHVPLPAPDPA